MPNSPKPIKLLLFSDIHFGKFADLPPFKPPSPTAESHNTCVPMGNDLVRVVKSLEAKPDVILVLGDLTSIGSPSEFDGCVKVLRQISADVGVPFEKVFFTFGNHDVDWRVCSLGEPTEYYEKDPLYSEIATRIGSIYAVNPVGLSPGPVPGSGMYETEDFKLFIANSGRFCTSKQEVPHGKLGSEQIKWLREVFAVGNDDLRWRILMVHHHPFNYKYPTPGHDISTLEEGAELLELIGQYKIDFICHGHRHHPKHETQLKTSWKRPATFFCAGSLAVHAKERSLGRIPNLFHVVDIESRLPSGGAFGRVRTYEYSMADGWRPINNTSETPLDHIQFFGAITPQNQLEEMAGSLLSGLANNLQADGKKIIQLPQHASLAPEFQCCSLAALNSLFKAAAIKIGFQIIGSYPGDIGLFKF